MQVDRQPDMNVEVLASERLDGAVDAYSFMSSVLEASTEYSIIATDQHGVITLWNEGARRLYGYQSGDVIGRHKSLLHTEKDVVAGLPGQMTGTASELGKWEGTVERVRKDGTSFMARVVMTLRRNAEGEPIGFLLMSGDITDQLRLAAELIRKLDELELSKRSIQAKSEQLTASLKYKSEFLANMSHELRTPLSTLLILAGLLQENTEHNLTARQVQWAGVIHASGTDLMRLIGDILDLAGIESGAVSPEISALALMEIQDTLQHEFGEVAYAKRLSFSVELADGLPSHIATDRARLLQVLRNLLENAVKFTERGAVRVQLSLADSGWSATNTNLTRADTVIAFRISDTGIGMAEEVQQRIFGAFIQGDGTTARKYDGTGLGLAAGHALVELIGGEITLASGPDRGSTFTVYLPTTPHPNATAAPDPAPQL
jgi:PAS domain S-box-containing protein